MTTIVGFTGTRHGMTEAQKTSVSGLLENIMISGIHHGCCIGADAEVHSIATMKNIPVLKHPPIDTRFLGHCPGGYSFPAKAYHPRNRDIVDMSNWLIAAPWDNEEQLTGGTWMTVRYARVQKLPAIFIVWPSGLVDVERT